MWKWNDLKRLLRLRKQVDVRELAGIMWPALYPDMGDPALNPRDAHCTIVYLGEIKDFDFDRSQVLSAMREVFHPGMFIQANVNGVEWFGPEQNVPVLTLDNQYLYTANKAIRGALARHGVVWNETHPEYRPHVTITDEAALSGLYPKTLLLGPVELWWAGEHISLNKEYLNV